MSRPSPYATLVVALAGLAGSCSRSSQDGSRLAACLGFILLFWAGTAPDVMRHEGTNWQNTSARSEQQP